MIAISTEFAVLLCARFREERSARADSAEALRATYASTGAAVLASGATAIAGFAVLAFSDVRMLRDFGLVTVVDLTRLAARRARRAAGGARARGAARRRGARSDRGGGCRGRCRRERPRAFGVGGRRRARTAPRAAAPPRPPARPRRTAHAGWSASRDVALAYITLNTIAPERRLARRARG